MQTMTPTPAVLRNHNEAQCNAIHFAKNNTTLPATGLVPSAMHTKQGS